MGDASATSGQHDPKYQSSKYRQHSEQARFSDRLRREEEPPPGGDGGPAADGGGASSDKKAARNDRNFEKSNGSTGPCVTVGTKEFANGEYINTTATFRAYSSLAASVEDHASFIASNARYKNILHVTDAQKVCELIQQDGYATDPDYATKLYDIIKEYKLTQYDTPASATAPVANKHTEVVKQGTFFIRSTTNPLGGIVGIAKNGQTFITTILTSGWRQISYNGRTAYIGPAAFK